MFEELQRADIVLDNCGRAVAPAGYRFVDLPYFIPLKATFTPVGTAPFVVRVKNNAPTQFICRGIIFECNNPVRVKWPTGRFLSQGPSFLNSAGSPVGTGGNMIALDKEQTIESGADITVEVTA